MPIPSRAYDKPEEYFIGQITEIRDDPEGRFGPQVVVEITPLGEMNPRIKGFNNEGDKAYTSRRSGFQKFLKWMRKVGLPEKTDPTGKIVKIQLISRESEIDGEMREWDDWKTVKIYTNESDALEDLQAMEANTVSESTEPTVQAAQALGGITVEILTEAKAAWDVLKNETTFRSIAPGSYKGVDVDALVAAIKAG